MSARNRRQGDRPIQENSPIGAAFGTSLESQALYKNDLMSAHSPRKLHIPASFPNRASAKLVHHHNSQCLHLSTELAKNNFVPTIFSHPAVPLAIGLALGSKIIPTRLLVAGVVASIVPDLDVIAFRLGIPYASDFGHRGFTHSLTFAMVAALFAVPVARFFRASPLKTFLFLAIAMASHGILDAFTNGGLGVAFLWPWSGERFFAPHDYHHIEVSPIGARFFSARGLAVITSELKWVWLPAAMGAAIVSVLVAALRRRQ
jgi:inner membrane protein